MTIEEPEIIGKFEGYRCNRCRHQAHVFVSHGLEGPTAAKSTTIYIHRCAYCEETDRYEGMKRLLESLIDQRTR